MPTELVYPPSMRTAGVRTSRWARRQLLPMWRSKNWTSCFLLPPHLFDSSTDSSGISPGTVNLHRDRPPLHNPGRWETEKRDRCFLVNHAFGYTIQFEYTFNANMLHIAIHLHIKCPSLLSVTLHKHLVAGEWGGDPSGCFPESRQNITLIR